jgi:hypothetical protein
MARVRLTSAMHIGQVRYKAGTTLADSQVNAIAGDAVWTGLNSTTWHPGMTPLDAGANALKAGSIKYANVPAMTACDGVSSVDA